MSRKKAAERRKSLSWCGVYCIINISTGKLYIGGSVNIYNRWSWHKAKLKQGYHHCIDLQEEWNSCGANSFEFRVIKFCKEEKLISSEQAYLDLYSERIYNIKTRADGKGFTH